MARSGYWPRPQAAPLLRGALGAGPARRFAGGVDSTASSLGCRGQCGHTRRRESKDVFVLLLETTVISGEGNPRSTPKSDLSAIWSSKNSWLPQVGSTTVL